jgi:hypothetical protein
LREDEFMFENILNWRLLSGSHKFPGPDGGTCINEAAVVAADFEYRAVQRAGDCPACFSWVIAGYSIPLNDAMSDELRQELLMPFVTRLAGTADSPEREIERARYIAIQTIKRILPISLRAVGLEEHALRCEQVDELNANANAIAVAAATAAAATAAAIAAANVAAATAPLRSTSPADLVRKRRARALATQPRLPPTPPDTPPPPPAPLPAGKSLRSQRRSSTKRSNSAIKPSRLRPR